MEYYNSNIQLDKDVITDIFREMQGNKKILVFGLGYDSQMWYNGNQRNTFFVENNDKYIQMNITEIPANHIIKYNYTTTCETCMTLTDSEIEQFVIPQQLSREIGRAHV